MFVTDITAPACAQANSTNPQAIGPIEFLTALFAFTEEPVYICSFTNERGEGAERHIMTRLPSQISGFINKWDKPGRGLFFCVSAVDHSAAKRNKETVRKTTCLHADIDFKLVDIKDETAREECLRQLARLRFPPSLVVFSGGGLHCYWLFKEPGSRRKPTSSASKPRCASSPT
jgi:hypothetical protein